MRSGLSGGSGEKESVAEIVITPLVDVGLVLVIIFMVTAKLLTQPNLEVALPKAITGEGEEKENITLTITKDGQWAVNENQIPFEKLHKYLKVKIDNSQSKYVIIRADQESLHKYLVEALSLSKDCGAAVVSIAVEQKQRG